MEGGLREREILRPYGTTHDYLGGTSNLYIFSEHHDSQFLKWGHDEFLLSGRKILTIIQGKHNFPIT